MNDELEQSLRFTTYVNYLLCLEQYLRENFNNPLALIDQIISTPGFKKIQGGHCRNIERVGQLLRNAWFTEIQLGLFAPSHDLLPYSNHWAPVQLYYHVFLAIRAFFEVMGQKVDQNHTKTLRVISTEISSRPYLFPYPWKILCLGDPERGTVKYRGLPNNVTIQPVSSLCNPVFASFWDFYGMFLRTTRVRHIKRLTDDWKQKNGSKKTPKKIRENIVENLHPTSIFDALYRLRIRSNYTDADSFLLSLESQSQAIQFNTAIQRVSWVTMLLLELLISKYLGKNRYSIIVDSFSKYDVNGHSERMVKKRFSYLREML